MKIAISGAGIAGTTLAYWLSRSGHQPVLIEQAPEFRTGGYLVDFWGLGYQVARKMGIEPKLIECGYEPKEVRFVNSNGERAGGFSMNSMRSVAGDFVSIQRSALARMIFETLEGPVETRFSSRITALHEEETGVEVTFADGAVEQFDLVIGADGQHSGVRALCFGEENNFETYLGYAVAAFELTEYRPRDEDAYVIYPVPSHQVARFALREDRTLFLLVFRCDPSRTDHSADKEEIIALIRKEFQDLGWETPAIMGALEGAEMIYFDRMSQIKMPRWHKGRVALLGDAAAAVSLLAGEGTGLAMIEAYVLAGELHRANGDYRVAFPAYEDRLRSFLEKKQKSAENFASTFVPSTDLGVWFRNQASKLMSIPGASDLMLGNSLKDDLDLPDYQFG